MRPWKSFAGLSSWMMRLAVLLVVVSLFHGIIMTLNIQSMHFFLAAGFGLAALFLVLGGFFSRHGVTMFAALALLILAGLHAYWSFGGSLNDSFARFILIAGVSVHFLANGNK